MSLHLKIISNVTSKLFPSGCSDGDGHLSRPTLIPTTHYSKPFRKLQQHRRMYSKSIVKGSHAEIGEDWNCFAFSLVVHGLLGDQKSNTAEAYLQQVTLRITREKAITLSSNMFKRFCVMCMKQPPRFQAILARNGTLAMQGSGKQEEFKMAPGKVWLHDFEKMASFEDASSMAEADLNIGDIGNHGGDGQGGSGKGDNDNTSGNGSSNDWDSLGGSPWWLWWQWRSRCKSRNQSNNSMLDSVNRNKKQDIGLSEKIMAAICRPFMPLAMKMAEPGLESIWQGCLESGMSFPEAVLANFMCGMAYVSLILMAIVSCVAVALLVVLLWWLWQ